MRKLILITLGVAGALVAMAVQWRPEPPGAAAPVTAPAPAREPPVQVVRARDTRAPSVPATARTDDLVRNIERALRSLDELERESVFMDLLPDLIAHDAAAAGRLVESLEPGPARDQLREHVVQQWAAYDLEGAISWVTALEDDRERKLAAADVTTQLARSDPAAALEISEQFDVGRDDGRVEHLAQTWAEANPDEASKWVRAQPPGPARDQMMARVALVQAGRDPAQAAHLVATEMSPGPARNEAALQVVRTWAASDVEAAASWIAQFPDGEVRRRGKAELARAGQLTP
jgi:hypothetical protein